MINMPYVKSDNYGAVAELLKQVRKSATMQKADFPDDLKERTHVPGVRRG